MFEDDNFQDEEVQVFTKSEWEPKSPFGRFIKKLLKILKKLPKIIFFTLVAVVWIAIFAVIALRSNSKLVKTPIFSDAARQDFTASPSDFTVYEVHTSDFMNDDGTIQLIKTVYAETAHELEVGLRIKGHIGDRLFCRIRDDSGNIYGEISRYTDERDIVLSDTVKFQYVFERISFGNVYIDVSENIINRVSDSNLSAEASRFESDIEDYSSYIDTSKDAFEQDKPTGVLYFEVFLSPDSEQPVFSCVIYDSDTPLEAVNYKLPDEKLLQ